MRKLLLACVATLALAVAFVAWRIRENALTAYQLCRVISVLIVRSDSQLGQRGSSTYDYFRDHPQALKAAHRETRRTLRDLPCE